MQDSDTEYHTAQDDESTDLDEELQAPDLPDAEEPAPSAIKKSLRQEAQTARMAGLDYKGCKQIDQKWSYVNRASRQLIPRAGICSTRCKTNSHLYACPRITDDQRRTLFTSFWQMNWHQRKIYVAALVDSTRVKRRRSETPEHSKRDNSLKYHFLVEGTRIPVCQKFFLATLNMKEWSIRKWAKEGADDNVVVPRNTAPNRSHVNERSKASIISFLSKLTKMPSHYCRADTNKVYLEPMFQTYSHLYREYKLFCASADLPIASETSMRRHFKAENISLFVPKRDQCDICAGFETGNVSKDEYNKHTTRKQEARDEKKTDVESLPADDSTVIIFVDLQKVLLAPAIQASATYYKTKLCCHNYTIYNPKSHETLCYLWNETGADLSSNTFSCLLYHYLDTNDKCINAESIIIYSDGCPYQNRCVQLSNTILLYTKTHNKVVYQKYLCKGHTQMQVDSCHALIERTIKNKNIYSPACYVPLIEKAKLKAPKYKVHYVDHDFFLDYKPYCFYNSIRPGRVTGDARVIDIAQLKYTTEISYKLHHTDKEWKHLPQRINLNVDSEHSPVQVNKQPIPLTRSKWNDLQSLKPVIPSDFHSYYDNLPKK